MSNGYNIRMNITAEQIINEAENTRQAREEEGNFFQYNLRYPVGSGRYVISIALGEGMYCSPRERFAIPSLYDSVEVAIHDTKSDSNIMSLSEIEATFGDEVARHCETYGYKFMDDEDENFSAYTCGVVMPYVEWKDVARIANVISTVEKASAPSPSDWNDEECQPF